MAFARPDPAGATNTDLLLGLRDRGNEQVWTVFCSRYQPVLVAFGRRLGLTNEDAQDAAQDTLVAFVEAYRRGQYDRNKGRLRTWLFAIAGHKVRDFQRRRHRQPQTADADDRTGFMNRLPDDRTMSDIWEVEWQRAVMEACLNEVRGQVEPATLEAFRLFIVHDWPADQVATHLGLTRNAVFKAQRRVLTRLRETYRKRFADWE